MKRFYPGEEVRVAGKNPLRWTKLLVIQRIEGGVRCQYADGAGTIDLADDQVVGWDYSEADEPIHANIGTIA